MSDAGGLGRMAANLLAAGHALTVYNRSPAKTESLVSKGAQLAKTLGDAADGQVVITVLANDRALKQIVFGESGILQALTPGAIHLSMSTIRVELAERLAAAHREKGQEFVSAPVLGRPDLAAAGKLFVIAGGKPATIALCKPLLDVLGQRTFEISGQAPKANLVKLSGNFLIVSVIEALGRGYRARE